MPVVRIPDVRQPDLFQRLVHRLYIAEYGPGLQVVDDSAGDRGNDGYDPARRLLLAVYCPEKDMTEAKALAKGRGDLAKAVRLAATPGYQFGTWVFVTPAALPEKVQATLRAETEAAGLSAQFLSGVHLEDMYLRHPDLRAVFPELDYPRVDQELAAINAKLDAVLATPGTSAGAPTPRDTTRPPDHPERDQPAVGGDESDLYWPRLSISLGGTFGGARLAELQRRVHAGDPEALFEVERLRLEATSPSDAAAAIMIQLEHATERQQFVEARRLAGDGRRLAAKHGLRAEEAVFLVREAHAGTVSLVPREIDMYAELAASAAVGFPLVSVGAAERFDREVPAERGRLDGQFREAYRLARQSRNLEALFHVATFRAQAATQSAFPQRLLLHTAHRDEARAQIAAYRRQAEEHHGLAIAIAAALQSLYRRTVAYCNFANDLLTFDDVDRALSHATHARRLAGELGDPDQTARIDRLLALIAHARRGTAPGSA